MPALTQVDLEVKTFRRWAARPFDARRFLRRIELAPCASTSPSDCLLRGTCDLPWGEDPGEAIRSLVRDQKPSTWPAMSTLRLFDFAGPVAQIDDLDAETELLSTQVASPIWGDLRDLARDRKLGMIELSQSKRLMVPVMALSASGASVDWAPAPTSTFLTAEALAPAPSDVDEDDDW